VLLIAMTTVARADFVRAKGQVMFIDQTGSVVPFEHVQVRLMDSDWDFDQEIARGFTDHLGRYVLSGNAGDSNCPGCGKPDPYVKVVLEDPGRVEVHDIMHFTRNAVLTEIREETSGEIDFGTQTFTSEYPEKGAAILYALAEKAYDTFTRLTGETHVPGNGGEVAIEIPVVLSGGTPYTTWDTIHWPGIRDTEDDYLSFDHEFGHRLRHAADGDVNHFNGDLLWYRYGRYHKKDEDTNLGFAFNEGWAHYFRHVMQRGYMDGPWTGVFKGNEVEGHVATKLIGVGELCGFFPAMWKALKANPGKIHSFPEFLQAFIETKPQCHLDFDFNVKPKPDPRRLNLPDSSILRGLRDQLTKQVDSMDQRSLASLPATPRIPVAIRTQDHQTVQRLWQRQIKSTQDADSRARSAYRKLVTGLQPMSAESIRNRSYERDARAARNAFITALAQPRLLEVHQIRREIAREKAKTKDPALLSYLTNLNAKYVRLEEKLKQALSARQGLRTRIPLEILPRSFVGGRRAG
jgi:hypothetical protein